ncbi:MAG: hypothetical protein ACTJFN_01300 [Sphingobacterium sp.]
MSTTITNFDELTTEIARLKTEKKEQEIFLKQQYDLFCYKIETPVRVANMMVSRVPGVAAFKGLASGIGNVAGANTKGDWLTRGLQLGLPLILSRTLLRNAGWLKKGLVLLASETAASQVNKNRVTSVIDRIANFIKPKKKNKPKEAGASGSPNPSGIAGHSPIITAEEGVQDDAYGIPKDSESF